MFEGKWSKGQNRRQNKSSAGLEAKAASLTWCWTLREGEVCTWGGWAHPTSGLCPIPAVWIQAFSLCLGALQSYSHGRENPPLLSCASAEQNHPWLSAEVLVQITALLMTRETWARDFVLEQHGGQTAGAAAPRRQRSSLPCELKPKFAVIISPCCGL